VRSTLVRAFGSCERRSSLTGYARGAVTGVRPLARLCKKSGEKVAFSRDFRRKYRQIITDIF
jgi:hypothetical protein